MKPILTLSLALLMAGPVLAADTAPSTSDQVKAAINKLKDLPNYTWTAKVEIPNSPFTPGPLKGQTEKDGFTYITQEFNGNTNEVALKGDKIAVKVEDAWELANLADATDFQNRSAMTAWFLARHKNAAEEALNLVGKAKSLSAGDGGLLSGDFTDEGAKDLLSFFPHRAGNDGPPPPKNAKGSVKFWIKDGALSKFESHLTGTVTFGQDGQEQDLEITRTVEIRDQGATKVQPPEDAKKKLEGK
jgi:hypothetical protein